MLTSNLNTICDFRWILDEFLMYFRWIFQPGCAAYPVKSSAPNCNFCFWSRCWIRHLKTNQNSRQLQNNFSFLAKLGEQKEFIKCIQWYLWVRSRVTWLLCIRLIVEMLRKCFKDNQRVLKSVSSCPGNCFALMERGRICWETSSTEEKSAFLIFWF